MINLNVFITVSVIESEKLSVHGFQWMNYDQTGDVVNI